MILLKEYQFYLFLHCSITAFLHGSDAHANVCTRVSVDLGSFHFIVSGVSVVHCELTKRHVSA